MKKCCEKKKKDLIPDLDGKDICSAREKRVYKIVNFIAGLFVWLLACSFVVGIVSLAWFLFKLAFLG